MNRRRFLVSSLGLSLGALYALKKSLNFQFSVSDDKLILEWKVKRNDNLILISRYFTGRDGNYKAIQTHNEKRNSKIRIGEIIKISEELVSPGLSYCLGLKPADFEVWTIDSESGIDSVAKLMENYIDYEKIGNYNETLGSLLFINNIGLQGIVKDFQNLKIPTPLIREDILRDRPEKIGFLDSLILKFNQYKPDYKKVNIDLKYQNPLKEDPNKLLTGLFDKDLFQARRIRTINDVNYVKVQGHEGLDLDCEVGTELYPIDEGIITEVGNYRKPDPKWRYGNVVRFTTSEGYSVKYCHLSRINVRLGQRVTKETTLGLSGISGNVSEDDPHLHLEFKDENDKFIDPAKLIFGQTIIPKRQS